MGDLVLELLTGSLSITTYNNYGTGVRRFTGFYDEMGIIPLHATAADMLRFTTWLARAGFREIVAASSLQPFFSAINNFFETNLRSRWRWEHFKRTHVEDSPCNNNPSPTPTFAYQSQHPSYKKCYNSPTDTTVH
jgi:hypothetical protein